MKSMKAEKDRVFNTSEITSEYFYNMATTDNLELSSIAMRLRFRLVQTHSLNKNIPKHK